MGLIKPIGRETCTCVRVISWTKNPASPASGRGNLGLIFGTDWPSSVFNDTLPTVVPVAKEYFSTRGRAAQEKYFWRNSVTAYKWKPRMAGQPSV